MLHKLKIIFTILIVSILIFLSTFNSTYTNDKSSYLIEYNGLLWVGLDYYTIWKYNSNDVPMKWVNFKKMDNEF